MDIVIVSIIIGVFVVFLLWLGSTKKLKSGIKRGILLFLAGAEVFHSIIHLYFWFSNQTIYTPWLIVTSSWNLVSGIVNGIIAIGLLYWSSRIKR